MKLEWTKNSKSEKDKQELEEIIRRATIPFGRLKEIIQERLEVLDRDEESIKDFDQPNWEHKQAFRNGVRATHKYYLNLLDFDKKILRPGE